MVEGPGATRNGRKVQVAVGKTVVATPAIPDSRSSDAEFNAPRSTFAPPTLPHHLAGELAGETLEEAFTVGKELFLLFNAPIDTPTDPNRATALRLHFGMNGSLIARKVKSSDVKKKPSGVPPWKQKSDPSLRLYFVDENQARYGGAFNYVIVEAWETTVKYPVSAMNSRSRLLDLSSRDACSSLFNAQDAFTSIRELGNSMIISDALLNQDIFPGVGNIIKIESLHRSKIDPRRIVSTLADAELRRIVRHTRIFSMDWLKSGRAGSKLVYNQTSCGTCKGMTVKMQKIGGSSSDGANNGNGRGHAFMSRVTFWCTVCQPANNVLRVNESSLQTPSNSASNFNNPTTTASRVKAQCPQHGMKSTKLCRVRKGNQNVLRIFYTCKNRACHFFNWADTTFPDCRCRTRNQFSGCQKLKEVEVGGSYVVHQEIEASRATTPMDAVSSNGHRKSNL
eukprot:CAMPEP_0172545136 /NCGR_PEP_ID=MMETSP1067-20121228/15136_1 /TAXON_ID=265564 ORGANISM="Thalassiosira punctigera, Strain Tpunct2005C2" /NCGR_SAMPLE_ID=MMETSP1067 /ASSEMBLY_ACC=CAM_ASM_000444 /LENGTH=451 /DNA_ID=CAMNT_0013331825 /DNA_START=159 /DNA_END=1511 /DNA_ORIENTATION=-